MNVVGVGKAAELITTNLDKYAARMPVHSTRLLLAFTQLTMLDMKRMRDLLYEGLTQSGVDVKVSSEFCLLCLFTDTVASHLTCSLTDILSYALPTH